MATGKTNNPEGINQYTKNGNSSQPYRYSVGGYFATQRKQKELNKDAEYSKKAANEAIIQARKSAGNVFELARKINEYEKIQNNVAKTAANSTLNLPFSLKHNIQTIKNTRNLLNAAEESKKQTLNEMKKEARRAEALRDTAKFHKSIVDEAEAYKPVSKNYIKNLAKQTASDISKVKNRMWGG